MIESLITKLHSKKPFLSVEITPALTGNLEYSREIEILKTLITLIPIDAFVCTDSPLARFKPSSILSSLKFQTLLQKPIICTLSMRDRNSIALCGDLLAVNELGIRAFLCLTGDPIKLGDCLESKGVFEENSLKLAHIIHELNAGKTLNAKPLLSPIKPIYNFGVLNSYANNPQTLKNKMYKKISQARPQALFTQPIYSKERAEFLLQSIQEINQECDSNTTLIFGFFPVISYKIALFLRDKLPGVFIPNEWITKLKDAHTKGTNEEYKVGLTLSQALLQDLQSLHNKIHFMSANKLELLKEFY